MSYLSSTSITSTLENFKSEAGQLPKLFHSKFNRKLIGGDDMCSKQATDQIQGDRQTLGKYPIRVRVRVRVRVRDYQPNARI